MSLMAARVALLACEAFIGPTLRAERLRIRFGNSFARHAMRAYISHAGPLGPLAARRLTVQAPPQVRIPLHVVRNCYGTNCST